MADTPASPDPSESEDEELMTPGQHSISVPTGNTRASPTHTQPPPTDTHPPLLKKSKLDDTYIKARNILRGHNAYEQPKQRKDYKAEIKALLLQLLGAGIADRLFSQLTPLHTISLIMATLLLHRNTHVILKPHLPHPTDTGEVEVLLVAIRHIPATHTPMQDIARMYHTTLHILRAHTHSTTDMDMHLIWMKTGMIHIPNKVS